MKNKYYSVRKGRKPGIYREWDSCKRQVIGYKGAEYKSFKSKEEAKKYLKNINNDRNIKDISELEENELIAYVDGSYMKDLQQYSYGVVLLGMDFKKEINGIGKDEELSNMRNVAGELEGAIKALEYAEKNNFSKIYLHYDYLGIEKWAIGEWKRNLKGTKRYKYIYNRVSSKIDIVFIKVDAHTGVKYNEEADRLAKEAFKK